MGIERRLFPELLGDLAGLRARDLQAPLAEIASGTSSFGARDEWTNWYHYLLGRLVPRSHEAYVSSLLESLMSCFMAIYPNGVQPAPYREFHHDVLSTLGCCVMEAGCWTDDDIKVGSFLHRSNSNPNSVWCWWDASGDFSASMFFCLKYLPAPLVQGWFRSVLEIPSPHWRAQVMVWLVGAHDILAGRIHWPSEFADSRPSIHWEWSHVLRPELASSEAPGRRPAPAFLPASSREQVLGVVRAHFNEARFLEWLDGIAGVSYLEAELAEIPAVFERMYVGRQP